MSERLQRKILELWKVSPIGGDEPGMVKNELPLKGQEIMEQIREDERFGRIPFGTKQIVRLLGPIKERSGRRVVHIFKIEYSR